MNGMKSTNQWSAKFYHLNKKFQFLNKTEKLIFLKKELQEFADKHVFDIHECAVSKTKFMDKKLMNKIREIGAEEYIKKYKTGITIFTRAPFNNRVQISRVRKYEKDSWSKYDIEIRIT